MDRIATNRLLWSLIAGLAMSAVPADVSGLVREAQSRYTSQDDPGALRLLGEAGFVSPSIEPTRIYKAEDARAFLKDSGLDADAVSNDIDGAFCSAFVRAIKPAAKA